MEEMGCGKTMSSNWDKTTDELLKDISHSLFEMHEESVKNEKE